MRFVFRKKSDSSSISAIVQVFAVFLGAALSYELRKIRSYNARNKIELLVRWDAVDVYE